MIRCLLVRNVRSDGVSKTLLSREDLTIEEISLALLWWAEIPTLLVSKLRFGLL